MEGIAKTAEQEIVAPIIKAESKPVPFMIDNIPLDVMRYFDVDVAGMDNKIVTKLTGIREMIGNEVDIGELLSKIRQIERKLGPPTYTESRYSRVWNYLKLSKRIKNL